ncbi:hypothetical protein [Halovivax gelatinilyticus]|uniref:hypothetical protein n=1 Tax=Halovivax gelatinilyticus TaxID=2961597 RepID=UPI0020CA750D|nr:hypothetical protein [Halovivax gelatinilyticus]
MNRRTLLCALPASTLLSGCLSSDPPYGLRRILIINRVEESVTATVDVRTGDDRTYRGEYQLDPKEPTFADSVEIVEDWMGDRVHYDVTISVDSTVAISSATSGSDTLDVSNGEISCFEVYASIDPDGVSIAHNYVETCEFDVDGESTK